MEFTNFLIFLESRGIHPELSPDPLSEPGLREQLKQDGEHGLADIGMFGDGEFLPENYNLRDIWTIGDLMVKGIQQNQLDKNWFKTEYGKYLENKTEQDHLPYSSYLRYEGFDHRILIIRRNLQRNYVQNNYADAFVEFQKTRNHDKY